MAGKKGEDSVVEPKVTHPLIDRTKPIEVATPMVDKPGVVHSWQESEQRG
jgi:hypothetical protein